MRRPDEECTTHPSPDSSGEHPNSASGTPSGNPPGDPPGRPPGPVSPKPAPPNAFTADLFTALDEREPEPAVPESANAGPWHVVKLHGRGAPLFACQAAGEPGPRLTFDAPDLANLAAATLAVSERPPRFRWQRAGDGRLHLLHDGQPVGTATVAADALPLELTRLADLRAEPEPLARFLASVPQDVLRRAGVLVMEILREQR